jgi:hypothetical protein
MSSLVRRMQKMQSRSKRALKAALTRQFATQLGVHNPKAKDLLARKARRAGNGPKPRALRRSKRSQAWLVKRSEARKAAQQ